jgi:hypothetical protein
LSTQCTDTPQQTGRATGGFDTALDSLTTSPRGHKERDYVEISGCVGDGSFNTLPPREVSPQPTPRATAVPAASLRMERRSTMGGAEYRELDDACMHWTLEQVRADACLLTHAPPTRGASAASPRFHHK